METFVKVSAKTKRETYLEIIPQIKALVEGETNLVANLANVTSALKLAFPSISWVGFYLIEGNQLVLGPFQGKPACVRIAIGKGVCGTSAHKQMTIIVQDVEKFPGHIVCDPDSKSEIVIPIIRGSQVLGVLDVDSAALSTFDETDKSYLEELCTWLSKNVFTN